MSLTFNFKGKGAVKICHMDFSVSPHGEADRHRAVAWRDTFKGTGAQYEISELYVTDLCTFILEGNLFCISAKLNVFDAVAFHFAENTVLQTQSSFLVAKSSLFFEVSRC